jgi:hypothetical protein
MVPVGVPYPLPKTTPVPTVPFPESSNPRWQPFVSPELENRNPKKPLSLFFTKMDMVITALAVLVTEFDLQRWVPVVEAISSKVSAVLFPSGAVVVSATTVALGHVTPDRLLVQNDVC